MATDDEIRLIMIDMFGKHTVEKWSSFDLTLNVLSLKLTSFVGYPEHVVTVFNWVANKKGWSEYIND